jgi:hypothetical protein
VDLWAQRPRAALRSAARASNGRGLVHTACTVALPSLGAQAAGRGAASPLWGARDASRVAHPGPGSRDQGSPGPTGRARARRGRGAPATCVVSRWQTRVGRGDLRRPISCPVRPGYIRAYGVPGPGSVIWPGGRYLQRGQLRACPRCGLAARERARCGECGGQRAAAHPLLPLRTRRRPEERTGRTWQVSGDKGVETDPRPIRHVWRGRRWQEGVDALSIASAKKEARAQRRLGKAWKVAKSSGGSRRCIYALAAPC